MKPILFVFTALFLFLTSGVGFSESHQTSPTRSRRPVAEKSSSVWNLWGLKERVWGAYEDTITWDVDVVFGKKATDNFAKAVLKFLQSSEGRRFVFKNKDTFLKNTLENTGSFEEAFWEEFESWLQNNKYKDAIENQFITAVNLLPLQPKLRLHLYYPQTPLRNAIGRGVDSIQYLLADDMAQTLPGGNLAPGILANGIRRAARGGAILPSVQQSYNRSRNALTQRIVNLIGVLTKKLVQQGITRHGLDLKAEVTVSAWESTEGFKKNATFPIRSYFYAANEKNALIPYQVTDFLDSLDAYRFENDIKTFGTR